VTERRDGRVDLLDVAQIDAALRQLPDHNLTQAAQSRRVLGRERDLVFFVENFRNAALEIETSRKFFARLIERVIDLLFFYFGNNVE
jgi:hypothetical protein